MIIDRTYFWGELRMPFIAVGSVTASAIETAQRAELDKYIAKYEPILLKKIFGDLYDTYIAERGNEPWSAVDALIVDSTAKTSIIANYVYFHYWNSKQYGVDDSGTYLKTRESGTVVSNGCKTIPAWNEMIDNIITLLVYLSENMEDLVTENADFTNSEWGDFVIDNGRSCHGRYLNEFGL